MLEYISNLHPIKALKYIFNFVKPAFSTEELDSNYLCYLGTAAIFLIVLILIPYGIMTLLGFPDFIVGPVEAVLFCIWILIVYEIDAEDMFVFVQNVRNIFLGREAV